MILFLILYNILLVCSLVEYYNYIIIVNSISIVNLILQFPPDKVDIIVN